MHVASLELCKELWKLSTWADTDYQYFAVQGDDKIKWVVSSKDIYAPLAKFPAYSLGYLLRKLEPWAKQAGEEIKLVYERKPGSDEYWWRVWCGALLPMDEEELGGIIDDNPTDVVCHFTIELVKANLIPIEEGKTDATRT